MPTTLHTHRRRRLLAWLVFVAIWTALLVAPIRVDHLERTWFKGLLSKSVHLGGYIAMTVLAGRIGAAARTRLLLLFFVMAHAGLTEVLQLHTGRTGLVYDVAIDHAGVLLGLYLGWRDWTEGMPTRTGS